jgi:acetyltransferase-like isoleucine patch superfamily enzyme
VTLGQTTHLDPGAYVRGTHAIALGEQILVHPRAQLVAIHGPLSIGDKCIISEKCVIGGPVHSASESTDSTSKPVTSGGGSNQPSPLLGEDGDDDNDTDPVKTTIHSSVYIHASSHIHAGVTIKDAVLIEPHVTVLRGVSIGSYAKICAGVTVDRDVEDWAVVYGNGNMKRRRTQDAAGADGDSQQVELVEATRLKAMDKEREGTVALFKMAARMASLAKKK